MRYSVSTVHAGTSLHDVITYLVGEALKGNFICCEYEGHKLYSDKVSVDSAFTQVYGVSYEQYLAETQQEITQAAGNISPNRVVDIRLASAANYVAPDKLQIWEAYKTQSLNGPTQGSEIVHIENILKYLHAGEMSKAADYLYKIRGSSDIRNQVLKVSVNLSNYGEQFLIYLKQMRAMQASAGQTTSYF